MGVKSLGMALGLANARPPGSAKFANAPPPGRTPRTDKAGKCPAVARGEGGGAGHRWNCLMHKQKTFLIQFFLVEK